MIQQFSYTSERGHLIGLSLYGGNLDSNAPCVLYLHGFKGFKDWGFAPYVGHRLAQAGIRMLAMNFSHNGIGHDQMEFTELEKFRDNTFSLEVEEAQESWRNTGKADSLAQHPVPRWAFGHSRGGGVALLAFALHPDVAAICTWASVCSFARYPKHIIDLWEQRGFLEVPNARTGQMMHLGWHIHTDLMEHIDGKLSIQKAVAAMAKPLCIVHGDADEAVPESDARSIFEWAENAMVELHIVAGAGHTFGAKHPFEQTHHYLETALGHTIHFFSHHLTK